MLICQYVVLLLLINLSSIMIVNSYSSNMLRNHHFSKTDRQRIKICIPFYFRNKSSLFLQQNRNIRHERNDYLRGTLLSLTMIPDSSSSTTTSSKSSSILDFSSFQFASNGVCISPRYFVLVPSKQQNEEVKENDDDDVIQQQQQEQTRATKKSLTKTILSSSATTTNNDDNTSETTERTKLFTMRNVPGEGDCMFLAVTLAALASMGLGGNDVLLRAITKEIRTLVATIFESSIIQQQQQQNDATAANDGSTRSSTSNNDLLIIDDIRGMISTYTLLKAAAKIEKISIDEYITRLKLDGNKGGMQGGGPELTILSNLLRRPISIYHLISSSSSSSSLDNDNTVLTDDIQYIECVGSFGSKHFVDPLLLHVPNSAILSSTLQPYGAYSWHLHLLIVDSGGNEKHACVLLPQQLDKQK